MLKSDLTTPGLKCSRRVPLTRFNLHLEEVTRLPWVSDFSSIKHETWVLYNFQSLSCMQHFCVSRNTPELVERGRRGHESDDAHLWLYLKNKNQRAGNSTGKCCRHCSYQNAGWIEPKIVNAPTANAGKLPWNVSLVIELLKGKVTHSVQRPVPPLLTLFMGSAIVIQRKRKTLAVASISLKNKGHPKTIKKRSLWLAPKWGDSLMGEGCSAHVGSWVPSDHVHLKPVPADPSSS